MRLQSTCLVLTGLLLLPSSSWSQGPAGGGSEPADVEELRKELRLLRSRMQQIRSALDESAEYDRMSSESRARARKILDGEAVAEGGAPELPGRAPGARGEAPAGKAGAPTAARRRPAAPVPDPVGTVRGKVAVPAGEPVAYVFVENIRGPATPGKLTIEQSRKQFVPPWAVVQRGKTIEFPNLDNIYHNVFSLSSGNSFDLGLYSSSGEPKAHTFIEPGVVDIHCNIHPNMAASVLVVPNRHFARVRADGTFELPGVPSGRRKIAAWSPGSKLSSDWVQVDPGSAAEVTLRLEAKSGAHTRKDGRPYGSYE